MKQLDKYCLDLEKLCNVDGLLHTYFYDIDGRILACNKLQLDFIKEILGTSDLIGQTIYELLGSGHKDSADIVHQENMDVIESQLPRQFYNVWMVQGLYKLELLTVKMPIYDTSGKLSGVFGISQYLNKFSVPKAFELGLTKRETECLFLLLEGKSIKQVANNLGLSTRTVESYLDNMKNKLGCSTKSELILKAVQSDVTKGVISSPPVISMPLSALSSNTAFSLSR